MKSVVLTLPPLKKFVESALGRMGWSAEEIEKARHEGHPQEDYVLASDKYPIFAVADGVTLVQYLIEKKGYPNPSPAGDAARIFCEACITAAEARYESFGGENTREVFRIANEAVGEYNRAHGRTEKTTDYWDTDFYAATGAFCVIKDGIAYWASICDSYVAHLDAAGSLRFKSPDCNAKTEAPVPPYTGDPSDKKSRQRHGWRTNRNAVTPDGKLSGYGVITGEENATRYLNTGQLTLAEGETLLLLTDGFEEYLAVPEFRALLAQRPDGLEARLRDLSALKADENPEAFGHERSLIVVSV